MTEFQQDMVLTQDGVVGKQTLLKLDSKFLTEPAPPPLPPMPKPEYRVPGVISRIDQNGWFGGESLCWAAALTMMFNWRDQITHRTRDIIDNLGIKYRILFERGSTLPNSDYHDLLRRAGMKAMTPSNLSETDWLNMLRVHGALWVGAWSGVIMKDNFRHAFVLYGLTQMLGSTHVLMINPDGGREYNIHFETFYQMFENAEGPEYPQVRFFPGGR